MANGSRKSSPQDRSPANKGNDGHGSSESDGSPESVVLGDFELGEVIGRGGMGTVYRAWQRSLQRTVALKVLADHIAASPKSVQRFEREARAAAKLHHTHIVPIFARGEDKGKYYYTMELVEGRGLNTIIAEERARRMGVPASPTPLDLAETVPLTPRSTEDSRVSPTSGGDASAAGDDTSAITLQPSESAVRAAKRQRDIVHHIATIADGLKYAHSQGVIHRDVKPHNLILGDDGRMRIADFGLARIVEAPGVTMTGEVVGSPLYMAPELLTGSENVDHRADVYSLGATMYEWLTLSPPHPGETREAVISHILQEDPPPLRTHDPAISVDLETICLKAMHREPARRYANAGDFRDDLRRLAEHQDIRATRAGFVERSMRAVRRHQVAAVLIGATVIISALALALIRTGNQARRQSDEVARLQADSLDNLSDQERLDLLLRSIDPLGGATKSFLEQMIGGGSEVAEQTESTAGKAGPNPDTVRTANGLALRAGRDMFDAIGRRTVALPLTDELSVWYDYALDLRDTRPDIALDHIKLYLSKHADDVHALQLRASLQVQLGRFDDMAADAEDIVRIRTHSAEGFLWRGLARLFQDQAQLALRDLQRAADNKTLSAWANALRGIVFLQQEKYTDAIMALDDSLADAPDTNVSLLARAEAHANVGNYRTAVGDVSRVLQQEPQNAAALVARGDHHMYLGEFEEAFADYDKSVQIAGDNLKLATRRAFAFSKMSSQISGSTAPPATPDTATLQVPTAIPSPDQQSSSTDVRLPRARSVVPRPPGGRLDWTAVSVSRLLGR